MRHAFFFICLFGATATWAQSSLTDPPSAVSPADILQLAFRKGDLMVAISEVDWRPGLCLAAAQLAVGQSATLSLALVADVDYTFLGVSSASTDLDLYVHGPNGELIVQDQETDATPITEFKVPLSGNYSVSLQLVGASQPINAVALALLQLNGEPLLPNTFRSSHQPFTAAAAAFQQPKVNFPWLAIPASWCAFGYLLTPNSEVSLNKVAVGKSPVVFAGSTSNTLKNFSLYLANSRQQIVAHSDRLSGSPIMRYTAADGAPVDLHLKRGRGRGSGLLLLGLFQEDL